MKKKKKIKSLLHKESTKTLVIRSNTDKPEPTTDLLQKTESDSKARMETIPCNLQVDYTWTIAITHLIMEQIKPQIRIRT